jgi:hypothetical protein
MKQYLQLGTFFPLMRNHQLREPCFLVIGFSKKEGLAIHIFGSGECLLFPEKEAKSVVPLRGRKRLTNNLTMRAQGLGDRRKKIK